MVIVDLCEKRAKGIRVTYHACYVGGIFREKLFSSIEIRGKFQNEESNQSRMPFDLVLPPVLFNLPCYWPTFGTLMTSSSGLSLAGFSEQSNVQRSGTVLTATLSTRSM